MKPVLLVLEDPTMRWHEATGELLKKFHQQDLNFDKNRRWRCVLSLEKLALGKNVFSKIVDRHWENVNQLSNTVGKPRWPHTHTLISSMTEWPIFTRCRTADTNHSPGIIWRIQTCLFVWVLNERYILRRWCLNASGARLTHPDAIFNRVQRPWKSSWEDSTRDGCLKRVCRIRWLRVVCISYWCMHSKGTWGEASLAFFNSRYFWRVLCLSSWQRGGVKCVCVKVFFQLFVLLLYRIFALYGRA